MAATTDSLRGEANAMIPRGGTIALPDPSRPISGQEPLVLLAMCIFGEVRGESGLARRAVAQVILNRASHPRVLFGSRKGASFAENVRAVILQPQQFSSLNPCDPNYAELLHPLDYEAPEVWERCLRCAETALNEKDHSDTLTMNSDHYFDDSILPPAWASPAKKTVKIGSLNFYRLYLPRPSQSSGARNDENSREILPSGAKALEGAPSVALAKEGLADEIPARTATAAEPADSDSDPSSGSRLPAKVRADAAADSLAPGPHPPRPPMSLPAPKSSRSPGSPGDPGPRHIRDWSRGLSLLALLALTLLATACSDFERAAYRVLAVTQAEYQTTQQHVAEAAVHGLITEDQWNRFQIEGHRFIAAHNAAVDAFALWSQTKSKDDTARLQAMLDILPRLVREINALVENFAVQQPEVQSPEPETRSQERYLQNSPARVNRRKSRSFLPLVVRMTSSLNDDVIPSNARDLFSCSAGHA